MNEREEREIKEMYQNILDGKLGSFPMGFWNGRNAQHRASVCVRYLLEDVLEYDDKDITKLYNGNTLKNNKLAGMLKNVYGDLAFEALQSAYPNKFKPWETIVTPRHFWNSKMNRVSAIVWLMEKYDIKYVDAYEKIKSKMFKDSALYSLLRKYEFSIKDLLDDTLPTEPK